MIRVVKIKQERLTYKKLKLKSGKVISYVKINAKGSLLKKGMEILSCWKEIREDKSAHKLKR